METAYKLERIANVLYQARDRFEVDSWHWQLLDTAAEAMLVALDAVFFADRGSRA